MLACAPAQDCVFVFDHPDRRADRRPRLDPRGGLDVEGLQARIARAGHVGHIPEGGLGVLRAEERVPDGQERPVEHGGPDLHDRHAEELGREPGRGELTAELREVEDEHPANVPDEGERRRRQADAERLAREHALDGGDPADRGLLDRGGDRGVRAVAQARRPEKGLQPGAQVGHRVVAVHPSAVEQLHAGAGVLPVARAGERARVEDSGAHGGGRRGVVLGHWGELAGYGIRMREGRRAGGSGGGVPFPYQASGHHGGAIPAGEGSRCPGPGPLSSRSVPAPVDACRLGQRPLNDAARIPGIGRPDNIRTRSACDEGYDSAPILTDFSIARSITL
ncbi:hypothetical protein [Methylobacterium gregans]|uniref:hypothetical protein n=1 Tax=Methylobacterium gregans TaxID=374424 RepID=UPI003611A518